MNAPTDTLLTAAALAEQADFQVGTATVHPSIRTVSGPGGSVQVEPRIMQVLITLADAQGAVVTRELLFARCWGGVFVGDDSLNRAIAGVRRIAEAVACGSFEIQTVPRTGYRLIGEVHSLAPDCGSARVAPEAATTGLVTRRWAIGGALAAAAVGGLAIWGGNRGPDPASLLIEQSRVAMRSSTPDGERKAIALLEQAVFRAPDSAEAWGLLALTRARVDEHVVGRPVTSATKVDEAARRALQLDPDNADAKSALAVAVPYYGDWLAAESRLDKVLAEHPDHLFTMDSRAFFLGAVGRMREGARDRLALKPRDAFDADLQNREVYAYWFLGQITDADQAAQRGLAMWPEHPALWFARLWVLAGTGRLDRALAHVDEAGARPRLPPPMVATLRSAILAARTGDPADVESASKLVMAGVGRSVGAVINAMMLLNLMQSTDLAFDLAQAYYLEQGPIIAAMDWRPGQPFLPDQRRRKTNMLFTPVAATMQRDQRFMPLMKEMGLTDYWHRRGILPDFLADRRV